MLRNGDYVVLTEPGDAGEPAFFLDDGRAVQGDAWAVVLDEHAVERCRAAAGAPAPVVEPELGAVTLRSSHLLTDDVEVVELSTDTGWVWAAEQHLAGGRIERVAAFPDTRELVLRGLADGRQVVREFTVPLGEDLAQALAVAPCFELDVELHDDGTGTATASPC